MPDKVIIAVDAMGGDDAPGVVLEGCAAALAADPDLHVVLCGPADVVGPFSVAHERCTAQPPKRSSPWGSTRPMPCAARRTRPSWWGAAW